MGSDTKPTAGNQASVQGFEIWQPAFNNVRRSNTREAVPASTPLPAWGRVSGADSGTGASSKCPFERSSSSPRASLGQGSYFSGSHGDSQPHLNGSLRKKDKSLSQSNVTDFLPKSRSSPVGLKTQSLCGFSGTPCTEREREGEPCVCAKEKLLSWRGRGRKGATRTADRHPPPPAATSSLPLAGRPPPCQVTCLHNRVRSPSLSGGRPQGCSKTGPGPHSPALPPRALRACSQHPQGWAAGACRPSSSPAPHGPLPPGGQQHLGHTSREAGNLHQACVFHSWVLA